jgi:hypothetical protein
MDAEEDEFSPTGRDLDPGVDKVRLTRTPASLDALAGPVHWPKHRAPSPASITDWLKRERFPHSGNGQIVLIVDFGRARSVPHCH